MDLELKRVLRKKPPLSLKADPTGAGDVFTVAFSILYYRSRNLASSFEKAIEIATEYMLQRNTK